MWKALGQIPDDAWSAALQMPGAANPPDPPPNTTTAVTH